RQSAPRRPRGPPRRPSALAEAPPEQVHLQAPGSRAADMAVGAVGATGAIAPFPDDVGVSIVCHNNLDKLRLTLPSLDAAGCPHSAVLLVDVASTDGTIEWLRREYPAVRTRTLPRNDGPSPGRNVGIRECRFPYVFLMDADVQVQPETIQRLRRAMATD